MALWDKLRVELDRAGRVAQTAIDESKVRLEAFRARQVADRAAQSLGWAVYHARTRGDTLDDATMNRLLDALADRDREVAALEAKLRDAEHSREHPEPGPASSGASGAPGTSGGAGVPDSAGDDIANPSPS